MTLKQRLANQRRKRDVAAHNYKSNTAKIKTLTARLARRPKLGVHLAEKFDLRITSTWRSVAHNAAVGGVPGSWHTKGSLIKPAATDLVGSSANMEAARRWAATNVHPAENMIHDVGSGLHLHIAGWNVANWDWPKHGRLKRLFKLRAGNRKVKRAAQKKIDQLKRAIAKARAPQTMSVKGRAFLKREEGVIPHAYNDPVGFATFGVGHLIARRRVTAEDERRWGSRSKPKPHLVDPTLRADLKSFEAAVRQAAGRRLPQHKFDALVSLAFNIGVGGFSGSTAAHRVRRKAGEDSVADAIKMWNVPSMLTARRAREARLYTTGRYS